MILKLNTNKYLAIRILLNKKTKSFLIKYCYFSSEKKEI